MKTGKKSVNSNADESSDSSRPRNPNGEGNWTELKNGYKFKRQYGVKADGKPNIIVVTGRTQRECRKKMDEAIRNQNGYILDNDSCAKLTLTELCMRHLDDKKSEDDSLKNGSISSEKSTIHNQIEKYPIGQRQIVSIRPSDIRQHIEDLIKAKSKHSKKEKKLSISRIEKAYDVINSAFKWAIAQGYLSYNPCVAVHEKITLRKKSLKSKRMSSQPIKILSPEEKKLFIAETNKLYNNGKPRYRVGLGSQLLLETGIRVGELCAFRWSDWDRKNHTLSITKTRYTTEDPNAKEGETRYKTMEGPVKNYNGRRITLSQKAEEILSKIFLLSDHQDSNDYIILNRAKRPTCPTRFITSLNLIFENAGMIVEDLFEDTSGAHIFRRTWATQKYREGVQIIDIAAYLGDEPTTIEKYYIARTEKIKEGGEIHNVVPYPTPKK